MDWELLARRSSVSLELCWLEKVPCWCLTFGLTQSWEVPQRQCHLQAESASFQRPMLNKDLNKDLWTPR